ncbi:MAG: hypothetical protein ACYCO3_05820 [Mycobacteriales bacterium]
MTGAGRTRRGAVFAHRNAVSVCKEGALDAVTSMVTHAPTLLVVTGLAAGLAYLRRPAARTGPGARPGPAARPLPAACCRPAAR